MIDPLRFEGEVGAWVASLPRPVLVPQSDKELRPECRVGAQFPVRRRPKNQKRNLVLLRSSHFAFLADVSGVGHAQAGVQGLPPFWLAASGWRNLRDEGGRGPDDANVRYSPSDVRAAAQPQQEVIWPKFCRVRNYLDDRLLRLLLVASRSPVNQERGNAGRHADKASDHADNCAAFHPRQFREERPYV